MPYDNSSKKQKYMGKNMSRVREIRFLATGSTSLPIKGTGHMDIVCDQYGDWWGVCLANRPITYPFKHNLGRETFLVPVEWDDKDWPVIGRNGLLDERISSDRKLHEGVMQKSQTDEGKHFHDEFVVMY